MYIYIIHLSHFFFHLSSPRIPYFYQSFSHKTIHIFLQYRNREKKKKNNLKQMNFSSIKPLVASFFVTTQAIFEWYKLVIIISMMIIEMPPLDYGENINKHDYVIVPVIRFIDEETAMHHISESSLFWILIHTILTNLLSFITFLLIKKGYSIKKSNYWILLALNTFVISLNIGRLGSFKPPMPIIINSSMLIIIWFLSFGAYVEDKRKDKKGGAVKENSNFSDNRYLWFLYVIFHIPSLFNHALILNSTSQAIKKHNSHGIYTGCGFYFVWISSFMLMVYLFNSIEKINKEYQKNTPTQSDSSTSKPTIKSD